MVHHKDFKGPVKGARAQRRGKKRYEVLVERLFYVAQNNPGSAFNMKAVLREPLPLLAGRDHEPVLHAARTAGDTLLELRGSDGGVNI